MAFKTQVLKFKQTVNASPSDIFYAWTNTTAVREWLCDAALVDPRKGGRIHLWWNAGYHTTGDFVAFVPNRKITFTWRGNSDPGPTLVHVALADRGAGTAVTLTHSDVGTGKAWAATVAGFQHEWTRNLENLKSVLETGNDLRFTLRPMLGVNIGEFNAEIAKKLGTPIRDGVRLDGALEGMGAYAAGLRKDDVLVNFGGTKLVGWPSLTAALQSHRAGDEVKVTYYRGPEKRTATMKLSQRPVPDMPVTAGGLADAMRKIYQEFDEEMAKAFDGVSEEEASSAPAPDEWSAKDVVCHLIAGERDTQSWISSVMGGQELWSEKWGGNVPQRHAAIIAASPTSTALLEMLRRNEAESLALVAAMPDAFVARRGSFWRLAYAMLQTPEHNAEHLQQIREAIASARK